jgi:pyruvate kinase
MNKSKQTKIVATIADNRCEKSFLTQLFHQGVDVFRLNTAHQPLETVGEVVKTIRSISDDIAILLDTKGPEVRTGPMETPLLVEKGDTVVIGPLGDEGEGTSLQVNYDEFAEHVPVGSSIVIDDGTISMGVLKREGKRLHCRVENSGAIAGKKTVNTPKIRLPQPSLTEKDKNFLAFAREEKIDFIAHSFVRDANDVIAVKKELGDRGDYSKVIAKIENQEGVENLELILDEAYGVMVARGDLAVEIPAWEVPVIQKSIIATCIERAQPVITATQMLHSMIRNPRPTRAEINDVANTVFDGSDALMLSGETAYGKYPIESVKMMVHIIQSVESRMDPVVKRVPTRWRNPVQSFLAQTAFEADKALPIKAIITMTQWGGTARLISSYRPQVPIYAKCTREHTKRLMALQYGVRPSFVPQAEQSSQLIYESLSELLEYGNVKDEDYVLIVGTGSKSSYAADRIEIKTIHELIQDKRKQFDYASIFKEEEN